MSHPPPIGFLALALASCLSAGSVHGSVNVTVTNEGPPVHPLTIPANFIGLSYEVSALTPASPGFQLDTTDSTTRNLIENLTPGVFRFGGNSVDELMYWDYSPTDGGSMTDRPAGDASSTELYESDVVPAITLATDEGWSVIWSLDFQHGSTTGNENNVVNEAQYVAPNINELGGVANYICIGNEPNLYDKTITGTDGFDDLWTSFWDPIKEVIETDGSNALISGFDSTQGGLDDSPYWMKTVAGNIGSDVSLMTNHFYALLNVSDGGAVSTVADLLSPSTVSPTELANFADILAPLASTDGVNWRVTETGGGTSSYQTTDCNNLAGALYDMDFMYQMAQCQPSGDSVQCAGVNFHCGAGGSFPPSPIQETHHVASAYPTYYGLLMFRQSAVGKLVALEQSDGGTINLDSFGAVDTYGNLRVALINKDLSTDGNVVVAAGSGYDTAQVMVLTSVDTPNYLEETDASNITLGGASVTTDGNWTPAASPPAPTTDGGSYTVSVGYGTAALVTFPNISLVQASTDVAGGSGSMSIDLNPTTDGDLLVATLVTAGTSDGGTQFTAPTGWTQAEMSNTTNADAEIWYYANCTDGTTKVTFTYPGTYAKGQITEWHGLSTDGPGDLVDNSSTATSTNTATVATIKAVAGTSANGSLDLAITDFVENGAGTADLSPGAGWTNAGNNNSTGAAVRVAFDYQIGVSHLLPNVGETETSSAIGNWNSVIATFSQQNP